MPRVMPEKSLFQPTMATTPASTDQRWSWRKLFGKDDNNHNSNNNENNHNNNNHNNNHNNNNNNNEKTLPANVPLEEDRRSGLARRLSRKVVPGLPRTGTFKRQQSELRANLEPIDSLQDERRTVSADRRKASSRNSSTAIVSSRQLTAPRFLDTPPPPTAIRAVLDTSSVQAVGSAPLSRVPTQEEEEDEEEEERAAEAYVEVSNDASGVDTQSISSQAFDELIVRELEKRWILNLSMHFRDKSRREKFFVTFAETPTHWRRVTISLDYRDASDGSLEQELRETRFQRDKSARIYEAIRESLPDIQFYDTVTNLKLQTEHERLHVHVVEDISEVISYPPVKAIDHLDCRRVREREIVFDSHLSGFVYKVLVDGQVFIKKEIPGPDTVDEFLYEINALHQLSGSESVIRFGGVVLDNRGEHVKGLLISYAEQGALIDVIYDEEGRIPWARRERWAKQIVQGLSEIHEAGFVQGDFTLSNIVIDGDDNAKIIDINRRGCPVGWEPPEVAALIASSQRISIYIGVKSDLYQLGMVLYALATQQDEPENHRPLSLVSFPAEVPDYYFDLCRRCLNDNPRCRSQALTLLSLFPRVEEHEYHMKDHPMIPMVADTCHYDDRPRLNTRNMDISSMGLGTHGHMSQQPMEEPVDHEYAATDTSEERDYPRRGRSPTVPYYERGMNPWEFPLPVSRESNHNHMGTAAGGPMFSSDDKEGSFADTYHVGGGGGGGANENLVDGKHPTLDVNAPDTPAPSESTEFPTMTPSSHEISTANAAVEPNSSPLGSDHVSNTADLPGEQAKPSRKEAAACPEPQTTDELVMSPGLGIGALADTPTTDEFVTPLASPYPYPRESLETFQVSKNTTSSTEPTGALKVAQEDPESLPTKSMSVPQEQRKTSKGFERRVEAVAVQDLQENLDIPAEASLPGSAAKRARLQNTIKPSRKTQAKPEPIPTVIPTSQPAQQEPQPETESPRITAAAITSTVLPQYPETYPELAFVGAHNAPFSLPCQRLDDDDLTNDMHANKNLRTNINLMTVDPEATN